MSNALDDFERALVRASATLTAAAKVQPPPQAPSACRRRGPLRRVRQLRLALQLAVLITSFSAAAGAVAAVYFWIAGGPDATRSIASFSCVVGSAANDGGGFVATAAVTGDPVVDCALTWVQSEGNPAPRLVAWGNALGVQTAVVLPASDGAPPGTPAGGWHRLPAGWTVDLSVVELNDQLNDISARMNDGPVCTYATRGLRIARSLLVSDHLHGWRVTLRANNGALSTGCRHISPSVDEATRTIQLIQIQNVRSRPGDRPASLVSRQRAYLRALNELLALQARANRRLAARCSSVGDAAALWTSEARAAGFRAATPAFWRRLQALSAATTRGPSPVPPGYFRTYTLVEQPASQRTGSCARLLIEDNGDTEYVYAARMAP